ncbi:MAG: outer membrane lipoprotein-sorting protein [Methylotenera sp.]|nr:outer membrane lipoprotein-sorting protein [Oligoflexia bacterium]
MKTKSTPHFAAATLAILAAASGAWATELTPKEVMSRSESSRKVSEITATCKLTQTTKGKDAKLKSFQWWRKIADNSLDYRTLVRFTQPAAVKGEGILIVEKDKAENEVLLYLPAFKKIRRVENQQQTGKFMGSEFSYSDIATPHLDDYTYSGGKQEPCPGKTHSGVACYLIEAKPASPKIQERTGYQRTMNWVRSDNFMVAQVEYFDLENSLIKRLEASDIRKVDEAHSKWMAYRTEMHQLKTGNSSLIEFVTAKVNGGVPESTFTQQNLSRSE